MADSGDGGGLASPVRAAAEEYRRAGAAVVCIPKGQKIPRDKGWPTRSAEPSAFADGDNIGIVGGYPSRRTVDGVEADLVCIDFDDPTALGLADLYLPPTQALEGRPDTPKSHRWYWVTGVPAAAESSSTQVSEAAARERRFAGPFTKHFHRKGTTTGFIDFIGTGGQTVVPPSYHAKSGTHRAWEEGHGIDKAAVVRFEDLWAAVNALAVAAGGEPIDLPDPAAARSGRRKSESSRTRAGDRGRTSSVGAGERHVASGDWELISMEERTERCRDYLAAIPDDDLPRSGQGGHGKTFRLAMVVASDFALYGDRQLCLDLLGEVNDRLREVKDEWSADELAHKVDDAIRQAGTDPRHPLGCRLTGKCRGDLPREWDNPDRLASGFAAAYTVRFVKDTAFLYNGRSYEVVSKEWLKAQMHAFAEQEAEQEFDRRQAAWDREQAPRIAELRRQAGGLRAGDSLSHADAIRQHAMIERQVKQAEKGRPRVVPGVLPRLVAAVGEKVQARAQLPDDTALNRWLASGSGSPPRVLAVADGLLDLDTGTRHPHSPDWFSVVCLPVQYDPSAPPPAKFLTFLGEVMEGDTDRIQVLQEILGGCLDLGGPGKWFAALTGGGDNGKSVFLTVVRAVLGNGNVSAVNLDDLTSNRFAGFGMLGKLANVIGDQGYVVSKDEGRLKALTGGDLYQFEQKGRDPISAVNTAKIIFAANALPSFADKSDATWNRIIPVPFNYRVPDEKKNPAMLQPGYWEDELPGILNWALEGMARLRSQGGRFTRSAACEALKHDHRLDSDSARRFLDETVEFTGRPEDQVSVADLYREYGWWCKDEGIEKPLGKPKFGSVVKALFPGVDQRPRLSKQQTGKRDRTWIGLRLLGDVASAPIAGVVGKAA